jgi:two-component system chemotaxis response regulator CheY
MMSEDMPYTALIVDDSAFSREWLAGILRHVGLKGVEVAESGSVALEKVRAMKPDLIFLDAVMPGMDGLTTIKELKKLLPEVVVVITSSSSAKETVLNFKEAGAQFYLRKPLEASKVRETLAKIFETVGHPREER